MIYDHWEEGKGGIQYFVCFMYNCTDLNICECCSSGPIFIKLLNLSDHYTKIFLRISLVKEDT